MGQVLDNYGQPSVILSQSNIYTYKVVRDLQSEFSVLQYYIWFKAGLGRVRFDWYILKVMNVMWRWVVCDLVYMD